MSTIEILHWPGGLALLGLVPLAWLALGWCDRARDRRLATLVGPRVAVLSELDRHARARKRALTLLGLCFALLALLRPRWGEDSGALRSRALDLVVCLDVSRSMLARDVRPTRLAAAQSWIRALAEGVSGERLALVLFAGEARLAIPLTADVDSFAELVDAASPESIGRGGTDLEAALQAALAALSSSKDRAATIVLLSDGEDLVGRGSSAAEECRQRGIRVHCLGLGSELGAKIAIEHEGGESFLRDRAGQEVISALDSTSLRRLATATGGIFVDAGGREDALPALGALRERGRARTTPGDREPGAPKERFQWPLLVATLLWMLELAWSERRRA